MGKKHSPPKPTPRKTFRRVAKRPMLLLMSVVLLVVWMIALIALAIHG